MTPVIQTENLTKVYGGSASRGGVRALEGLNLTVNAGEIFGYLGPNGAGKTTTIRLLLDLIRPTSGSARVLGLSARADSIAIRQRVGYLPAELALWDRENARRIVDFVGRARGGYDERYVNRLAERLQFDLSKPVRAYSTGNKRKLGIIIAMMNQPDLLILDEPSSGLDPLMQQTFYELVREVRAQGRTVFLSSHVLSEVQAICDRVAILRAGKLEAVQRVDQLTHADFRYVTLHLRDAARVNGLASVPGVSAVSAEGDAIHLQLIGDFDPLLRALDGYYVRDIQVREPSLEDVFLKFYAPTQAAALTEKV